MVGAEIFEGESVFSLSLTALVTTTVISGKITVPILGSKTLLYLKTVAVDIKIGRAHV